MPVQAVEVKITVKTTPGNVGNFKYDFNDDVDANVRPGGHIPMTKQAGGLKKIKWSSGNPFIVDFGNRSPFKTAGGGLKDRLVFRGPAPTPATDQGELRPQAGVGRHGRWTPPFDPLRLGPLSTEVAESLLVPNFI